MMTCQSPRKVMLVAHHLARRVLPAYSTKFSRHDFTLPQLFACLVLREHQKKSYRGVEALLCDAPHWCKRIGMNRVPDHNTLCRAFHLIVNERGMNQMLDLLARWFKTTQLLGSVMGIDSTLYDTHHRSRHYEQRCRHYSSMDAAIVSARRSASARRTPKLTLGADVRSHVVLSAYARLGMGSDCRDFEPILRKACLRHRIRTVLADAGYDSDANHQLAQRQLQVQSFIKTGAGRPTRRLPTSIYRRRMQRLLRGSQAGRIYGQRAQVETVHSMMKRNLGDSLRAHTSEARRMEQLLRVITHNVMLP
jgi:IS5 family transposase